MMQFEHTVKDPLGIHARPAGQIAKLAKGYADTVTVAVDGGDEAAAFAAMKEFFDANL